MLTNRSNNQAPIESIVFADIDETSILYNNCTCEHVHNNLLFNWLAKQSDYDLVLFSNMSSTDLQILKDDRFVLCITREQLIDDLQQKGFRVHGVITPADPTYNNGPGAAYQDLYKMAHKIATARKNMDQYEREFDFHFNAIQVSNWVQQNYSRKAAQKYAMFDYFLKNIPDYLKNLKRIHYYDDDKKCLEAVFLANYHASSSIEIVPFLVNGMKSIKKLGNMTPKISKLAMTTSDTITPYSDIALFIAGAALVSFGIFAANKLSSNVVDNLGSSFTPKNG